MPWNAWRSWSRSTGKRKKKKKTTTRISPEIILVTTRRHSPHDLASIRLMIAMKWAIVRTSSRQNPRSNPPSMLHPTASSSLQIKHNFRALQAFDHGFLRGSNHSVSCDEGPPSQGIASLLVLVMASHLLCTNLTWSAAPC